MGLALLLALLLAWTLTPILLYFINKKAIHISGVPAWVLTLVTCLVVAVLVNYFTDALAWKPFNILALVAIVYFGCHSFFTLVIKPYFPGHAGPIT